MKKKLFILLVIVFQLTIHAQKWVNYTTVNGLADNSVNVISIDAQGTKWFGTEYGGVSKFDGHNWTTFNMNNGLANNRVRAIAIDAQGNKWIGTIGGGVSKFDGTTWTTYTTLNGLVNNYVNAITIDAQGNKWFGTNAGVSKFDGTTWTSYTYDDLAYGVYTIAIDAQGNKWVGTIDGIYKFDGTTWTTVVYDYVMVRDIKIDRSGAIWAAKYGALKYDGSYWTTYTTSNGLSDNSVESIYVDSNNTKWFGTLQGFTKFDGTLWTSYTTVEGVGTKRVNAITIDSQGDLWIGTYGGGVSRLEHASIETNIDSLHIEGKANSQNTFEIISNTAWTVESNQNWLTVNNTSGSNNGTITLSALENPLKSSRTALVIVKGNNLKSDTITVVQDKVPDVLSATVETINVVYTNNSQKTFELISNISWTIESNQDWLTVSPASGSDNGTITVNVISNTVTSPRSAFVILKGTNIKPDTVTVIQAALPTELSVSINRLNIPDKGDNPNSFELISNTTWTAESNQDWLSVSPASGSNNGTITVNAISNTVTTLRSALVIIKGTNVKPDTVTVIQAASPTELSVSINSLNIPDKGDNQNACDIQSNSSWTVTSNQDWVTVSPVSGSNNAVLTLTTLENTSISQREAIVTITANGISKELTITQASMTTGFQIVSDTDIQLYPMPVIDKLKIVSLKPTNETLITIYSINGIRLYNSKMNGNTMEIDMSLYPSGLYYAKISNADGIVLTKKIVK